MTQKAETALQREIQRWVKSVGGKCIKVHGDEFTEEGTPDLVGVVPVRFVARQVTVLVPFALETKTGTNQPTKIQTYRMGEWSNAGSASSKVVSLHQAQVAIELKAKQIVQNGLSSRGWVLP